MHDLLRPGARFLNHGISRPTSGHSRFARRGFIDRYVFPDGELHEVGSVVSKIQAAGFEARHVESLREHYARTLRAWVANLERSWAEAVAEIGTARTRMWRRHGRGLSDATRPSSPHYGHALTTLLEHRRARCQGLEPLRATGGTGVLQTLIHGTPVLRAIMPAWRRG